MRTTLLPAAAACCLACSSSRAECACDDPAIEVRVPEDRAAAFEDISLSGSACVGVTAACAETSTAGCLRYRFDAHAAGSCHIDVDFSAGPPRFSADVAVLSGGCCTGFYANPRSAGQIDVPGASSDAGGTG
jgi:hypothetical protein